MNRKCPFALGLLLLLPLVTLACGNSSYSFDSNVRKLNTDIEPSPLMVEEIMQIPWGNGDGEVAHNPESSEHAGLEYIPGPHNIYVDSTGRFYVDDPFNKRVVLFNENGGFVRNYAYPEEGEPRSTKPAHILAGNDGVFYFLTFSHEVYSYDTNGEMITHWSYLDAEPQPERNWNENGVPAIATDGTLYILFFPEGTGVRRIQFTAWNEQGELTRSFLLEEPAIGKGWAIDSKGDVYINYAENVIGVFDSEGRKVREIVVDLGGYDGFTVLGMNQSGELFLTVYSDFSTANYLKYSPKGELVSALRDESKGLGDLDLMGGDSGYYIKCPLEQSEGVVTIFRTKL